MYFLLFWISSLDISKNMPEEKLPHVQIKRKTKEQKNKKDFFHYCMGFLFSKE